ncbi:MAG: hypothetical protein M3422_06895, partial [Actinomycetota bacterium]|nr:hypothetical protein [Actinomycetota bacterium]
MRDGGWVETVGVDARQWSTVDVNRTVLVAVHTVAAAMRLEDVVRLVESDFRVQVVYTQVPDVFEAGVGACLRRSGALTIPWDQAIRTPFDLVIGAAPHRLESLRAPRLVVPHGFGYSKLWPRLTGYGPDTGRPVYGLDPHSLTAPGQLVFSAIALSHVDQLEVLRRECPAAVPSAVVVGDPCYDRILASLSLRDKYRKAWGVRDGESLVMVTSTWGRRSLLGERRAVLDRLLAELPRTVKVVMTLHPAVWAGHGPRQINSWLRGHRDAGLGLVGPGAEWRDLLVAADYLVGDLGSVSLYGA